MVGGVGAASRHPTVYSVFADAAAYNPTSRSWRRLPPLPAPQADASVTWDGREVLVVGGHYGLSRSALIADGIGYNPATNHWRVLSAMDTTRIGHTAVWTGHRLWVWWTNRPRWLLCGAVPRGRLQPGLQPLVAAANRTAA